MPSVTPTSDLVLLGGGHCHALLLRQLAKAPIPGLRLTLVSESGLADYSGMLPGLVAGHYELKDCQIDLNRLCQRTGVRFICARVVGLNPETQRIALQGQPDLAYDWLSINTGAAPRPLCPDNPQVLTVKPVAAFYQGWQRLLAQPSRDGRWAVLGAGAGGLELVLAMAYRIKALGRSESLHLAFSGTDILPGYPQRVRHQARLALKHAGVQCHPGIKATKISQGQIQSSTGDSLAADHCFVCTPVQPPNWLGQCGLALSAKGFLQVNAYLQSSSHSNVFACGDIADVQGLARPKAGVFAIRQAPFLAHNLAAIVQGSRLKRLRLQRHYLSILALGERQAIASKAGLSVHGAWVWWLKDRIDRQFMAQFSPQPRQAASAAWAEQANGLELSCANPVIRLADSWCQRLDAQACFSPDPQWFARTLALQACSPFWAAGAKPRWAQAWLSLAADDPRLKRRDAKRLEACLAQCLTELGVELLAMPCRLGQQPQLGLSLTGQYPSQSPWPSAGAEPGHALVLTKPLGSPQVLQANTQAQVPWPLLADSMRTLLQSNQPVADCLSQYQPSAVNALAGHSLLAQLQQMQTRETLVVDLWPAAMPYQQSALWLLAQQQQQSQQQQGQQQQRHSPSSHLANLSPYPSMHEARLWLEPQLNGGLLIALPRAQAEDFCLLTGSWLIGQWQLAHAPLMPNSIRFSP